MRKSKLKELVMSLSKISSTTSTDMMLLTL
jgi:hypothetical protein